MQATASLLLCKTFAEGKCSLFLTYKTIHNGYQNSFTKWNGSRRGGIAVYVKSLYCEDRLTVAFSNSECLFTRVFSGVIDVSLLAVYRPSSGNVLFFLQELKNNLKKLRLCYREKSVEALVNMARNWALVKELQGIGRRDSI